MGFLSGKSLTIIALLSCVGCGLTAPGPVEDVPASQYAEPTSSPSEQVPEFTTPSVHVRSVAATFARAVCEYDARQDDAFGFLAEAGPLATIGGQLDLRASRRAHLPWRVLEARAERTSLRIDGVSEDPVAATVVVRGTLTTRTPFATVRSFVRLTLSIRDGLVDAAQGTCL